MNEKPAGGERHPSPAGYRLDPSRPGSSIPKGLSAYHGLAAGTRSTPKTPQRPAASPNRALPFDKVSQGQRQNRLRLEVGKPPTSDGPEKPGYHVLPPTGDQPPTGQPQTAPRIAADTRMVRARLAASKAVQLARRLADGEAEWDGIATQPAFGHPAW